MHDQLTRLLATRGKPETVNDIVESRFEQLQERRAGHAFRFFRFGKIAAELFFKDAVNAARLLFFAQLGREIARFTSERAGRSVLTWHEIAALDCALGCVAPLAFQEKLFAFAAA